MYNPTPCVGLPLDDCRRVSHCQIVSGYVRDDGRRVKSYCRKRVRELQNDLLYLRSRAKTESPSSEEVREAKEAELKDMKRVFAVNPPDVVVVPETTPEKDALELMFEIQETFLRVQFLEDRFHFSDRISLVPEKPRVELLSKRHNFMTKYGFDDKVASVIGRSDTSSLKQQRKLLDWRMELELDFRAYVVALFEAFAASSHADVPKVEDPLRKPTYADSSVQAAQEPPKYVDAGVQTDTPPDPFVKVPVQSTGSQTTIVRVGDSDAQTDDFPCSRIPLQMEKWVNTPDVMWLDKQAFCRSALTGSPIVFQEGTPLWDDFVVVNVMEGSDWVGIARHRNSSEKPPPLAGRSGILNEVSLAILTNACRMLKFILKMIGKGTWKLTKWTLSYLLSTWRLVLWWVSAIVLVELAKDPDVRSWVYRQALRVLWESGILGWVLNAVYYAVQVILASIVAARGMVVPGGLIYKLAMWVLSTIVGGASSIPVPTMAPEEVAEVLTTIGSQTIDGTTSVIVAHGTDLVGGMGTKLLSVILGGVGLGSAVAAAIAGAMSTNVDAQVIMSAIATATASIDAAIENPLELISYGAWLLQKLAEIIEGGAAIGSSNGIYIDYMM